MTRGRGLDGQVVVVTGAGGGIARATASAFARERARLVLADVDAEALDEVVAELRGDAGGVEVEGVVADVTTPGGAHAVVERADERFGALDVLANVVGGSRPGRTVVDLDEDGWDAVVRLNLSSTFLMCRHAILVMARGGGGAIVNVSSGAGLRGMRANPAYCAAKAGIVGLTRALAIDHAADGIRVNAVAPGPVLTPLMRRNRTDEEITRIGRVSLLGRVADPDELADVIVFLAGDGASYLVGQTLEVDGGPASAV